LSPFLAWGNISLAKNTPPTYWGRKKQWPGSNPLSITRFYNSEEEQERRAFFGRPGEDCFELKVF
jgi:hypothetical protein